MPSIPTIEHARIAANGIGFHVASSGPADAPAALCLHGFPEGWMSWRPIMERVADLRLFAPDLRGYPGSDRPRRGYDVFTLTDDVKALIESLGLDRPVLVAHDWGGALGWIFAHRYPQMIRKLVVINCTHPKTLVRQFWHFRRLQPLRILWVPFFEIPWIPEAFIATRLGRWILRLSFTLREGTPGTMNKALVDELVDRFQRTADMHFPIEYYREMVKTQLLPWKLRRLKQVYESPIPVPITVIWGVKDSALPYANARESDRDAGREIDWRPLEGVDHFVSIEAPDQLASEIRGAMAWD